MSQLLLTAPQFHPDTLQSAYSALGLVNPVAQQSPGVVRITLPQGQVFSRQSVDSALRPVANNLKFDYALLGSPWHASDFKLLAMDMDSTLITIECIDEIADFAGKKAEVSAITEAAMRGEITNFTDSLNRRVALLKGVPASSLEAVYQERLKLSDGAEALIEFAQQSGWKTLLVSGGFTFFTDKMKERLGLDYTRSNTLEIVDGHLTGRVLGTIVDAQIKRETVEETCQLLNASPNQAIVVGDGSNDLKMMEISGASVAFRAKPVVQEHTDFCINHGGLDTISKWF